MASIEMDRASVATAVSLQKRPSSLSLAFRVVRFLATKAAGATSLKSSAVGHPRSRFEACDVFGHRGILNLAAGGLGSRLGEFPLNSPVTWYWQVLDTHDIAAGLALRGER